MPPVPQQTVRGEVERLLRAGVSGGVFPGATACVAWREGEQPVYAQAVAGQLWPDGDSVDMDAIYDLASLTKPFVAMAALRLVASGTLVLSAAVGELLPDVRSGAASTATLEQLLTHRAGLASWGGFYLDVPHDPGSASARRWILGEAARRVESPAGRDSRYSDLGYMIAGDTLARVAGRPLAEVIERQVTAPLGIDAEAFYAAALPVEARGVLQRVAPTEWCEWRSRLVRGEVHDENCAAMGGVAGHAGMFGTASSVARFGRAVLDSRAGRHDFLPSDLIRSALTAREGGTHLLGWDSKSGANSAAGKRMSADAFGHLGFTGTSIWCDPARDLVVVLLTNRVHPSRANQKIKAFRPAFHDGVVATMDSLL